MGKRDIHRLLSELEIDAAQTSKARNEPASGDAPEAGERGVPAADSDRVFYAIPLDDDVDKGGVPPPVRAASPPDPHQAAADAPASGSASRPSQATAAGGADLPIGMRVAPSMRTPAAGASERAAEAPESASAPMRPMLQPQAASSPTDELQLPGPVVPESSMTDIYTPEETDSDSDRELRSLLIGEGVCDARQFTTAENVIRQSPGTRLSEVLISQGADEEKLMRCIAQAAGLPFERLQPSPDAPGFDGGLVQRLTADYCRKNEILPLRVDGGRLVLGTSRPDDVFVVDDVRLRLKVRSIKVIVLPPSDIRAALALLDSPPPEEADVESILSDIEEDDVQVEKKSQEEVDLGREAAESPVIRYVNYIIQQAVKEGASDIHIEPGEKTLKVRLRVDGVLFESMRPPAKMAAAITSRLKIMANLDISERRIPQDGRIRCNVQGRKLDLRVSTLPTSYGEKTVMRILDTKSITVGLDDLGLDENTLTIWRHQIAQPHGIVLVTGPTGSGKTTTLYASLRQMDKSTMNVSTVEDPVEYHLEGITQTQIHEKIDMTFARALKALLRQDPDVIMIGEIRDQETAVTAVQAALTGHLVLSTLHTNDAPSAITRLVNIGLEPFLIAAAVNAVLAQRLVRKICAHCRQPASLTDDQREFVQLQGVNPADVFRGAGCDRCRNTGYSGRLGIYELLAVDDHLRDIIARNPNVTEFRRMCCERGMVSLRQDGFAKVMRGLTTVEEILRVTASTI